MLNLILAFINYFFVRENVIRPRAAMIISHALLGFLVGKRFPLARACHWETQRPREITADLALGLRMFSTAPWPRGQVTPGIAASTLD